MRPIKTVARIAATMAAFAAVAVAAAVPASANPSYGAYTSKYNLVVGTPHDCGDNFDQACPYVALNARTGYEWPDDDTYTNTTLTLKTASGTPVRLADYAWFHDSATQIDPAFQGYRVT